jgi:CMP-2-keto-3-deoxyoctulosonic acid synthetase
MSDFGVSKGLDGVCITYAGQRHEYHCDKNLQSISFKQFHDLLSVDRIIGLDNQDIGKSLSRTGNYYYIESGRDDVETATETLITQIKMSDQKNRSLLIWIEGDISLVECSDILNKIDADMDADIMETATAGVTESRTGNVKVSVWAGY